MTRRIISFLLLLLLTFQFQGQSVVAEGNPGQSAEARMAFWLPRRGMRLLQAVRMQIM